MFMRVYTIVQYLLLFIMYCIIFIIHIIYIIIYIYQNISKHIDVKSKYVMGHRAIGSLSP